MLKEQLISSSRRRNSPAWSPFAQGSGTQRQLREGPVKFIPHFSPLHPALATAGTLACRVGCAVYLTTPFACVSVSSRRLSPVSPHSWDQLGPSPRCLHTRALPRTRCWVRQREQSSERCWKGRGQKEASSGERGRESLRLGSDEGEAV